MSQLQMHDSFEPYYAGRDAATDMLSSPRRHWRRATEISHKDKLTEEKDSSASDKSIDRH